MEILLVVIQNEKEGIAKRESYMHLLHISLNKSSGRTGPGTKNK